MIREELLARLKKKYIATRLYKVEMEFVEFEEDMTSVEDLQKILLTKEHLSNPHNSVLLYLTGITDEYNPTRLVDTVGGSFPDIDQDFDPRNYHKIVEWVVSHYGRQNTANIMALQKFKPRSTVRKYFMVTAPTKTPDISDAQHEKAVAEHNKIQFEILNKIPDPLYGKEPTLQEIIEGNKKKSGYEPHPELTTDPRYKGWYEVAKKLEDMVSTFSIHAAGIALCDEPLDNYVPVWFKKVKDEYSDNKEIERWATQFNKDEIEALGICKFDFLRIENLAIIQETIKLIKERHGVTIEPYKIQDFDKKTYEIISQGHLVGVFQMETSRTALELAKSIKPRSISELSDLSALNRPGPIQAGLTRAYVENKNNQYAPGEMPDVVANLLEDTYWTLIYQEQTMKVVNQVAGFDLKTTDDIRRAIGKKNFKYLEPYRQAFIDGLMRSGVDEEYATYFWDKVIVGLADYQFNKSHSVTYAYVSYICAWLKANYPIEFFTALMSVRSATMAPDKWAAKAPDCVREAKHFGIDIRFPDINKSFTEFTIIGNVVYFGFACIKQVGTSASHIISEARKNTPFTSVIDFLSRIDRQKVNTRTFTQLALAGVFDSLGYKRTDLAENVEKLYDYFNVMKERAERETENYLREDANIEIQALIEQRDAIRKRAKKKDYVLTEDEQAFLEEHKRLSLKRPLKLPEIPEVPELKRYSRLEITLEDILTQGEIVGCFILHPAKLVYPDTTAIASIGDVSTYTIAGIIGETKSYRNSKGTKHYVPINDGTGSLTLPIFPDSNIKLPKKGALCWAKVRCGRPVGDDEESSVRVHKVFDLITYGA